MNCHCFGTVSCHVIAASVLQPEYAESAQRMAPQGIAQEEAGKQHSCASACPTSDHVHPMAARSKARGRARKRVSHQCAMGNQ
eukprot:13999198-Alexandrium_andersonii.AAC.1